MLAEQEAARSRDRRAMVGTGDRSAKIRTYNFPQSRVTDHRIHFTSHQIDAIMNGAIDPFVEHLVAHFETERLKKELAADHA
jgi:peptide chain release factor 1